jgi:hypothetical protein
LSTLKTDDFRNAEYLSRTCKSIFGIANNLPIFVTPTYVFDVDPEVKNPDVDYDGTNKIHIIEGHAFIEFTYGKQTILLALCLINPYVREAIMLFLDGKVDPKHGKFGRKEEGYETQMVVKDANGNFVWAALDFRPLLDALIKLESLSENTLKNLALVHNDSCRKRFS